MIFEIDSIHPYAWTHCVLRVEHLPTGKVLVEGPIRSFERRQEHRGSLGTAALLEEMYALKRALLAQVCDIHLYNGSCPDSTQLGARDPECPACQLLCRALGEEIP